MEGDSGGNVEVNADYIVPRGTEIQRLLDALNKALTEIRSLIATDEQVGVFPGSIRVWLIEIEKDMSGMVEAINNRSTIDESNL
jgi:hypothetical protein